MSVEQYLARYAEPEARLARCIDRSFTRVLVVPAFDEAAGFWESYRAAAESAGGTTLVIVVVNAHPGASAAQRSANAALLGQGARGASRLNAAGCAPACLTHSGQPLDLLLIDRTSDPWLVPSDQAVGLARRIGSDIALALIRAGKLTSSIIYGTDADVELPPDYFSAPSGACAAAVFPYEHVAGGDAATDRATLLYEISLRYYVLGLGFAGSPYAIHTIGSTLAVHADAYALVRGFPRRAGAEDFYLLNKLAKVAPIRRVRSQPVRIRARSSTRAPFGTGPAVDKLVRSGDRLRLYDPISFAALRTWLDALYAVSDHRNVARFHEQLRSDPNGMGPLLTEIARRWDLPRVLDDALASSQQAPVVARRVTTWFDAFRTLKWIHELRDLGLPTVQWEEALLRAPFVAVTPADLADTDEIGRKLRDLEALGPEFVGVTRRAGPNKE